MSDHVTALCRSRYYQLRQLRPMVCRALPETAANTLVQAFIILWARLLQRAVLRYHGQLVSASAVDPERGGATSDGHQVTRPHLISLVASKATGRLQTCYIGLQVAARRNPFVPLGQLRAHRRLWTPSSVLGRRQRSHCSVNLHSTRRQEFLGGMTESMEQSSRHTVKS